MAHKVVTQRLQSYIPKSERGVENPTEVFYIPMNKRQFDEWLDSMTKVEKGKVVTNNAKGTEFLYKKVLAQNPEGIVIKNVYLEGSDKISHITTVEQATKLLLEMTDLVMANEIERTLRGSSVLDEDEEKNSDGQ